MSDKIDKTFYQRANDHILLSNEQLKENSKVIVNASMMFGLARFSAWVTASGCNNANEMKEAKEKIVEYFLGEYKTMLNDSLDDYIKNFDSYMKKGTNKKEVKK